jgi:2-polyprenyl-3-methyl-5-hydroxy-6-metoxy-1,4-benzoquinol methylase
MGKQNSDSKALWLSIRSELPQFEVKLGTATAQGYVNDPKLLGFVAARYKFVAKMIDGCESALEVGCGDAFGAPIVAQSVGKLICTDIDEETLEQNGSRCRHFTNIAFEYFDFRSGPFRERVNALYSVDVIEHIFPDEEDNFVGNLRKSLQPHGVMLIGTPNVTAEKYASVHSRAGHVNLKDHKGLHALGLKFFHNVFIFSMNDELVHTGYYPMAHYLWALCVGPR